MYVKARVVVAYYDQYDLTGCRFALALAAGAWDAGAEVRVRCVRRLAPAMATPLMQTEVLRESAEVREASLHDLAWADAVYFVAAAPGDAVRSELGRLVGFVREHWACLVVSGGFASENGEWGAALRRRSQPVARGAHHHGVGANLDVVVPNAPHRERQWRAVVWRDVTAQSVRAQETRARAPRRLASSGTRLCGMTSTGRDARPRASVQRGTCCRLGSMAAHRAMSTHRATRL